MTQQCLTIIAGGACSKQHWPSHPSTRQCIQLVPRLRPPQMPPVPTRQVPHMPGGMPIPHDLFNKKQLKSGTRFCTWAVTAHASHLSPCSLLPESPLAAAAPASPSVQVSGAGAAASTCGVRKALEHQHWGSRCSAVEQACADSARCGECCSSQLSWPTAGSAMRKVGGPRGGTRPAKSRLGFLARHAVGGFNPCKYARGVPGARERCGRAEALHRRRSLSMPPPHCWGRERRH